MLGMKTPAVLILHVSVVPIIPGSQLCMSGVVWYPGKTHHGLSIVLQHVLGVPANVHLTSLCVCRL